MVREPGLWLLTDGALEYTLDNNDVLTEFSIDGMYKDLCALLND